MLYIGKKEKEDGNINNSPTGYVSVVYRQERNINNSPTWYVHAVNSGRQGGRCPYIYQEEERGGVVHTNSLRVKDRVYK